MLYDLIRTHRGKKTVFMTDTFANVNKKMKQLRDSQRGGIAKGSVTYSIHQTDDSIKFEKKSTAGRPH